MTVAFAALHRTLEYRGQDTRLRVVALDDGTIFFSRHRPPIYDAMARLIAQREVLPGSYVNVRYREERGQKRMDAVQVVKAVKDDPPFDRVLDDGHL